MNDRDFLTFPRAATGIERLDSILGGGFPVNRMYLIEGDPGAGKSTLALQFLLEGARNGEPGDTVILLRYFEAFGEVRKAISLVKRRTGLHESSVRELRLGAGGLQIGQEIKEFQGVLTGRLQYSGDAEPLLRHDGANGESRLA